VESYPSLAVSALFSFLGVLMAFVIGNTWQVRTAELGEASTKLRVLGQLASEVSLLKEASTLMQRSPPMRCRVEFQTPRWRGIRERNEDLLLRGDFVREVRRRYAELTLARQNSEGLDPIACQQFVGTLITTLDDLARDITRETNDLAAGVERIRGQVQTTRGLLTFLGGALAISATVLLVPLALYPLTRLVVRVTR
jgi:hypothetical protein